MIHTILILKKESGLKVWNKSYSEVINWDEYLTSGLISAILNFSQEIFGADVYDIELGPYKMLFDSESENSILVAVFDKYDSIINISEKLGMLRKELESRYSEALTRDFNTGDDFPHIDMIFDLILSDNSIWQLSSGLKEFLIKELETFRNNQEILDCDVISTAGIPLVRKWKKDFLDLCLRQIDAFWKSTQYMVDQITISYQKRHIILYKINEQLVLVASIRRDTPMGMTTFLIEDFAQKVSKIFK